MTNPLKELDPVECVLCGEKVYLCRMRDGETLELDPFPYHDLVVLNAKGVGMFAKVAFVRHSLTCRGGV